MVMKRVNNECGVHHLLKIPGQTSKSPINSQIKSLVTVIPIKIIKKGIKNVVFFLFFYKM